MKRLAAWLLGALVALFALVAPAVAQQPLKIGFGMSMTGPLAGNGKAALIAMEIWREDVNARGGILGRKVEFVYYDEGISESIPLGARDQASAAVGTPLAGRFRAGVELGWMLPFAFRDRPPPVCDDLDGKLPSYAARRGASVGASSSRRAYAMSGTG